MTKRNIQYWVIPPEADAEFVAHMKNVLETCQRSYARAHPVVCDNLNTHTPGAFYEVFEPAKAREYVRRIQFCFTPKQGSWLNIAENELSCMTRQCLNGRRIGELARLRVEIGEWSIDVTETQRDVDWQMTIDDARCKLNLVYPKSLI